ncbi:hypothetical protein INR76_07130 [Marixanthomonas sp. SCSIO 43207]|uniref:hypothetical protein n=1 Tax=Marixanthomonas sp. SCSIO 43207 TaxID=2779360 RepID=UPI001CA9E98A|nr:hypothetical protein [Marixanthomonas sp. SCSIO 43207]UAB79912.1 hypothetical protein INR76_07130 [Marixanthomonas sp. SCSIO 43207]
MRKSILILFLLASISTFAQKTLSDYSYVIVPDQFEFLEGKDKYQLNSLTKYLFNKYGFHAFLNSEAPNAKRCEGLYADITEENTIFRTKLKVVLKDCNGDIVYTGNEGNSRFKEFRKAYQDATRKAFESISHLNVNQKEVSLLEENVKEENVTNNVSQSNSTTKPAPSKTTSVAENAALANLPKAKFLNYKKDNTSFLLRKTNSGYSLYEEFAASDTGLVLKGTISVTKNEVIFTNENGKKMDAYFDENQNLSLFEGEQVMVYTLMQ